ncbi:MAG: RNA polymerase sigma factor [Candidatus Micrarchaeaceae archaeon]
MTADDNLFERIPWLDVYMRLYAMAGRLTQGQPGVFDAVSAEDLVSETVLEFLRSPNVLGWVPARGKIDRFLCAVLKNKFIDHIRRHRRYIGPLEEGDLFAVESESQFEQREAVDQVMQLVHGKKDLEDLVIAVSESNGGSCSNRELAADLGISVSEVVNRKKRIRRSCERDSPKAPKPRKERKV